jgi:hypothetical protein
LNLHGLGRASVGGSSVKLPSDFVAIMCPAMATHASARAQVAKPRRLGRGPAAKAKVRKRWTSVPSLGVALLLLQAVLVHWHMLVPPSRNGQLYTDVPGCCVVYSS